MNPVFLIKIFFFFRSRFKIGPAPQHWSVRRVKNVNASGKKGSGSISVNISAAEPAFMGGAGAEI